MYLPAHGGNVFRVAKQMGIPANKIIDFSANINPLGFPNIVRRVIEEHIDDIVHYPDMEQSEIKRSAAKYYNTAVENIIPGNGSVELINIILETLKPSKVLIPSPTFSEYARLANNRNIDIQLLDITQNDFKFDKKLFNKIQKSITTNTLLMICNPNNPTGNLIAKKDLEYVLEELKKTDSFMLVDEAFMDFVEEPQSMVKSINKNDNLIILKSLTKFFAVPGIRIGFALSNEELINRMNKLKDPWNVNTFAGLIVNVVLEEDNYIQTTRKFINTEKDFLWKRLDEVETLYPFYPSANFILVRSDFIKAPEMAQELRKKGILIRQCQNFDFLDESFFRVAVKDRKSNEALFSAIKTVLLEKKESK